MDSQEKSDFVHPAPEKSEIATPPEAQVEPAVEYSHKDMALIRRAIRERWAVPAKARQGILNVAAKVAADQNADNKDRLAAIRVLLEADRTNLDYEKMFLGLPEQDTLAQGQTIIFNVIPTDAGKRQDFSETMQSRVVRQVMPPSVPPEPDADTNSPKIPDG